MAIIFNVACNVPDCCRHKTDMLNNVSLYPIMYTRRIIDVDLGISIVRYHLRPEDEVTQIVLCYINCAEEHFPPGPFCKNKSQTESHLSEGDRTYKRDLYMKYMRSYIKTHFISPTTDPYN